ncbi:MAG: ABC transporter substrate-binding protein [Candidatus Omnitrophica bacterium]|nr:ABC transporter substrate-binding protein [Candidatus Omnitrophota bacterium]
MASFVVRIGHSPDPDDAFLFYAMTQGKIPMEGIAVTHRLMGIEDLNALALKGELEMTAISLHAYAYCASQYLLLTAGASVGEGYGPVIVAKRPMDLAALQRTTIAVPGKLTTAALLLRLAAGPVQVKLMPFDAILGAVKSGEVEAGVLIHEGQITYAEEGLFKVVDLGEWWLQKTALPLPLGVNVVRRNLGEQAGRLARIFKQSLDYAFAHRAEALEYAKGFGRGLDTSRTDRFVGMYVNRWALDCRPDGAQGMRELLDRAAREKLIPASVPLEFVEG